jgi:phage baseplate assembly protein W
MSTISVKLPLRKDATYGYAMNASYREVVKQNFKMLLLTNPGERMMMPNFGIGIAKYKFENFSSQLKSEITSKIREQVKIFMPFLEIRDIIFNEVENVLFLKINYFILPLSLTDEVEIDVEI